MAQNEIKTPKSVIVKESDNTDNEDDDEPGCLATPMLSPRDKKQTTVSPMPPLTTLVDNDDNNDDSIHENEWESKREEPIKMELKTPQNATNNDDNDDNDDNNNKPKPTVKNLVCLCFVQG